MRSLLLSTVLLLAGASAALAQQDYLQRRCRCRLPLDAHQRRPRSVRLLWHEWWRDFWLMELS